VGKKSSLFLDFLGGRDRINKEKLFGDQWIKTTTTILLLFLFLPLSLSLSLSRSLFITIL